MIEIKDLLDNRIELFTKYTESMLAHIYEPEEGLFLAESMKVVTRALDAGYEPRYALIEDRFRNEVEGLFLKYPEVEVYSAPFEVLTDLTGYHMTGGILCLMQRKKLPDPVSILKGAKRIALLENVVNPTNVGAIFRNAAALSMDGVLLSPGCADPLYKRAVRVSMGCVFQIPWTFMDVSGLSWPNEGMKLIKDLGFESVAMALDERAKDINDKEIRNAEKMVVLLGSEGYGLSDETLKLCDHTVMIPMSHGVDSLNVAATSAITFWELSAH